LDLPATGVTTDARGFIKTNILSKPTFLAFMPWVKGGPAFTHISYDDY
jgi:hypothetical protein